MAVRLRNEEKAAILGLLESDYASDSTAAAAILRGVAALLGDRDAFGVAVNIPGITLAYGPWYDLSTVKKAVLADDMVIFRLHSPNAMMRRLEPPVDKRYCECTHPWFAHVDRRWRPYRGTKLHNPGCMIAGCVCRRRGSKDV